MRNKSFAASSLTRRRLLGGIAASAVAASGMMLFARGAEASAINAERYVDGAGDELIAAARNGSASAFLSLLKKHVELTTFALFAIGRYRDQLGGNRSEYIDLVGRFMANTMATYADKFIGTGFDIVRSRPNNDGFLVETRMEYLGGRNPERVSWKVIESGNSFKVTDIYFKQVWLATLLRDQFTNQVSSGSVDSLMSFLRSAVGSGRGAEF